MTSRREATGVLAGGAATIVIGGTTMAEKTSKDPVAKAFVPGTHPIRPLPFAAGALKGLSEKLIVSHHENNYGGAVKNLNKVEVEIAALKKDAPSFTVAGLRERELTFGNSTILHELYFGNLGGDGKPGGAVQKALTATFGSVERWEEQFRAIGGSLGGGSGWAILELDLHGGGLRSHWSGHHTQAPASGLPLLVMDMYEHSYQMDYGAAAAKYVDAFFQNVRWDEVDRRFQAGRRASALLPSGG